MHQSVLLSEVISLLPKAIRVPKASSEQESKNPEFALDLTLGMGGHAEAMLEARPDLRVIGIDQDEQAIEWARTRIEKRENFAGRFYTAEANFGEFLESTRDFAEILERAGVGQDEQLNSNDLSGMAVILADLGISSLQLDSAERGFAWRLEGPLDMRMSIGATKTAAQILADSSEQELARIFRRGGLNLRVMELAKAIKQTSNLETTSQLAEVIKNVFAQPVVRRGKNKKSVSKKSHRVSGYLSLVFQAIRIEVNGEFTALEKLLTLAPNLLRKGGRLMVISFHSLEDKLVGRTLRKMTRSGALESSIPVIGDLPRGGQLVGGSPIAPSESEIEHNPRARSARLWVFEKS